MSEDIKPPKKTPYLAKGTSADAPAENTGGEQGGDAGITRQPRMRAEPILRDNEFLEPQGDIRLWAGLLVVPFVVLLFAFLQGFFSGDDSADDAAAVAVVAEDVQVNQETAPSRAEPRRRFLENNR